MTDEEITEDLILSNRPFSFFQRRMIARYIRCEFDNGRMLPVTIEEFRKNMRKMCPTVDRGAVEKFLADVNALIVQLRIESEWGNGFRHDFQRFLDSKVDDAEKTFRELRQGDGIYTLSDNYYINSRFFGLLSELNRMIRNQAAEVPNLKEAMAPQIEAYIADQRKGEETKKRE